MVGVGQGVHVPHTTLLPNSGEIHFMHDKAASHTTPLLNPRHVLAPPRIVMEADAAHRLTERLRAAVHILNQGKLNSLIKFSIIHDKVNSKYS